MADQAPSAFTTKAAPAGADVFPYVQSPFGSGDERKLSFTELQAALAPGNVAVTSSTNVTSAAHAGKRVFLTSSGALTVNGSTGFADYGSCEIFNWTGGSSTVTASDVTIDVPVGLTAVISQGGVAVLTRKASAGNYHLAGDLVAA